MVYTLLVPGRMAVPTILCCVIFILVMSLFGWHYPALSGLMPSYLVVRRKGFGSHILVTQDPLCDLSLVQQEVMVTVSGNNLQNFHLLILVSQWQASTSIIVGNGLQILDQCRLGAPWVRSALSPSLLLFRNAGLWSKGFMLPIDTAGTPKIQWLYTVSMTPGEILLQSWLILALLIIQRISYLSFKRLILMTYTTKVCHGPIIHHTVQEYFWRAWQGQTQYVWGGQTIKAESPAESPKIRGRFGHKDFHLITSTQSCVECSISLIVLDIKVIWT
jgi:hypothetical protein